ncbi:MAG: hypothetical protein BWK80_58400 [Desulfobacteraceae bacterium IS3]|nr:MAG: hypothetical protein BWK80_58400 [Desulfobacteraceae bacterium IS3]
MGELIEIVFENIGKNSLTSFLTELSDFGRNIKNYYISSGYGHDTKIDWQNSDSVSEGLEKISEGSMFVNLNALNTGSIPIRGCSLRIIHYDTDFDLEINFDSEDIPSLPDGRKMENVLHDFAVKTARKYGITDFYGGIEPAVDADTRFFTCENVGPLAPIYVLPDKMRTVTHQLSES